jgi:hypothetical protein
MAARAFGGMPSGFSFDASLMMLASGSPYSRAVSSMGLPA